MQGELQKPQLSTKEEIMAVKILIRRKFKHATMKDISAMLFQARCNAMKQKGYISSETLASCEDPNAILVVSMWQTRADWQNYRESPARQENERKYAEILEDSTKYEEFNLGIIP
jgi:heme-degrading monooxygenase HmoA